ncbi:MAG: Xaa-Pro dipeptidase, partial [Planctomycetota bacterium]
RAIKDSGELKLIRQAIRIAQSAFLELTANGPGQLIGRTEGQVAAELEYLIRQAGAQGAAFDIIVAAGANSSKPHHTPGATKIKFDQPVLFDWGAKVGGYCSDLTRVVFPGKIPPKFREIYDVVRQAQQAGIDAVRASVRCTTPDAAARAVIEQAGYGEQFTHSLGHGIGLDIHEAPGLARKSAGASEVLRAGMVVTVEPGIYLPGLGGVRIEDDVLVTATGCRRLTRLGRRIQESGVRSQ